MASTRETAVIDLFNEDVDKLMARLEKLVDAGESTRAGNVFANEMAGLISRYHVAAFMSAADNDTPTEDQSAALVDIINEQSDFAFKFAEEIKGAAKGDWNGAWNTRARLYTRATRQSYQAGKVFDIWDLLEQVPGDCQTQCCTNCKCRLDVRKMKGSGNYNVYWRLNADESCEDCIALSEEWNPLKIRDGELA